MLTLKDDEIFKNGQVFGVIEYIRYADLCDIINFIRKESNQKIDFFYIEKEKYYVIKYIGDYDKVKEAFKLVADKIIQCRRDYASTIYDTMSFDRKALRTRGQRVFHSDFKSANKTY